MVHLTSDWASPRSCHWKSSVVSSCTPHNWLWDVENQGDHVGCQAHHVLGPSPSFSSRRATLHAHRIDPHIFLLLVSTFVIISLERVGSHRIILNPSRRRELHIVFNYKITSTLVESSAQAERAELRACESEA
jgi:hypothetical protein